MQSFNIQRMYRTFFPIFLFGFWQLLRRSTKINTIVFVGKFLKKSAYPVMRRTYGQWQKDALSLSPSILPLDENSLTRRSRNKRRWEVNTFLAYVWSWELGLVQTSNFSLWAIDRFDSSNVIGLDKTKTNSFGREGLGLFLFFLLPYAWRPYCNIILAKGNSVKLAINYSKI